MILIAQSCQTWLLPYTFRKASKELSTENPPPARNGHSAVFDVQTSSMLVFGGLALNSFEATCDDGQHMVCALLSFHDCFDLQSAGNSRVHVDFCEVFVAKFVQCPEVSFLGWPIWIKKWQQKLHQWDFGMTRNAASHHAGVPSFAAFELGGRNLERAFPRKSATGAKWSFSRLRCANFIDAGVRRSGPQFFRGDL